MDFWVQSFLAPLNWLKDQIINWSLFFAIPLGDYTNQWKYRAFRKPGCRFDNQPDCFPTSQIQVMSGI
jgi:hypothetical protein